MSKAKGSATTPRVIFHYHRPDGHYDGWGLHLWSESQEILAPESHTSWEAPVQFESVDGFGGKVTIDLQSHPGDLGFIIHRGEEKDIYHNRVANVDKKKIDVWLIAGQDQVFKTKKDAETFLKQLG